MTVLIIHLSSYLHSFPTSLGISSWCLKLFKSSLWCPWTLPLQLQVFSEVFYCFLFYLLLTKFCIPIALFYPPQTVFFPATYHIKPSNIFMSFIIIANVSDFVYDIWVTREVVGFMVSLILVQPVPSVYSIVDIYFWTKEFQFQILTHTHAYTHKHTQKKGERGKSCRKHKEIIF